MKVLILSSNNGGGHNAVAKAIAQCFTAHGDECTVRDCLSYVSDHASELVSRSHDFMYRHTPELFDSSYRRAEENPEAFKEHHRVRPMIELGQFGLGKAIRDEGSELVIFPEVPIIASGGGTEESIRRTIQAGANAITYTPPTAQELFKITMAKYREM